MVGQDNSGYVRIGRLYLVRSDYVILSQVQSGNVRLGQVRLDKTG